MIVEALEQFKKYLYRKNFLLRMAHAVLAQLMKLTNLEEQLTRWLEHLQKYILKVQHRLHSNPNNLS